MNHPDEYIEQQIDRLWQQLLHHQWYHDVLCGSRVYQRHADRHSDSVHVCFHDGGYVTFSSPSVLAIQF